MRLLLFFTLLLLACSLQIQDADANVLSFIKEKAATVGKGLKGALDKTLEFWTKLFSGAKGLNPPAIPLPEPTKTTPVSLEDGLHFAHLSAATYCDGKGLADWACKECKANKPNVDVLDEHIYRNASLKSLSYIALDHVRKQIVTVNRGTENFKNMIEDLKFFKKKSEFNDGVEFHLGFYETTYSLRTQILPALKELVVQYPDYAIVQTGHSLGGSMSTIFFYLLKHDPVLKDKRHVLVTFGEPRSGNKQLADFVNAQEIVATRFTNGADIVAHIYPFSQGFYHHETEIWTNKGVTKVCRNDVYEDPTCSNSLPGIRYLSKDHVHYFGLNFEGCAVKK